MTTNTDDSAAPINATPEGTVAVIGGGTMGAGIAQNLLQVGRTVVLIEATEELAGRAAERLDRALAKAAERGHLTDAAGARSRLTVQAGNDGLAECPSLVIEAVPEVVDLKLKVLGDAEAAFGDARVLASNTSSLSIDNLAGHLQRPERFIGMHFFNPVPASQLIENVRGAKTSDATVEEAIGWARVMGKEPIVVRDAPGFASSRLGVALGLEAIRMVEEGVASAQDIDTAMKLGYKHPVGPLYLSDLVGLDIRMHIAEYLAGELGPRFEPPKLMREMVERGDLGRKSGKGFYEWDK